jgi:hypothetical protein
VAIPNTSVVVSQLPALREPHLELGRIEGFVFFLIQITLIKGFVLFPHEKYIETMWKTCGKHCTTHITWK